MPWELLLHGGSSGVIICGTVLLWKGRNVLEKMNRRLDKDEDLKKDFPPHRHINGGTVLYPDDYQPSPLQRLQTPQRDDL